MLIWYNVDTKSAERVSVMTEFEKHLLQENAELRNTIEELTLTIESLNQTLAELREQLNKNSRNSSKPPSSDGLKKPAPKSLRKPSGKSAGGQRGHKGVNLAVTRKPDKTIHHMPEHCSGCSRYLTCMGKACVAEVRYVVDAVAAVCQGSCQQKSRKVIGQNKVRRTNQILIFTSIWILSSRVSSRSVTYQFTAAAEFLFAHPIRVQVHGLNVTPIPGVSPVPALRMGSFRHLIHRMTAIQKPLTLTIMSLCRRQELDCAVMMLETVPIYKALTPLTGIVQTLKALGLEIRSILKRPKEGL